MSAEHCKFNCPLVDISDLEIVDLSIWSVENFYYADVLSRGIGTARCVITLIARVQCPESFTEPSFHIHQSAYTNRYSSSPRGLLSPKIQFLMDIENFLGLSHARTDF